MNKKETIKRLKEIKNEIKDLVSEADSILKKEDPELQESANNLGWIRTIRDSLEAGEMKTFSESMVYMGDTIHVLDDIKKRRLAIYGRG